MIYFLILFQTKLLSLNKLKFSAKATYHPDARAVFCGITDLVYLDFNFAILWDTTFNSDKLFPPYLGMWKLSRVPYHITGNWI